MSDQIIEIDGGFGSGGGQILRTATALAAVTKRPCHIFNIRAKRPKPGLMPQHLLGIQNVAKFCNGCLEGDKIGSEEIKFYPREISGKDLHIKIKTAASVTLLLQCLLPPALFASNPFKIFFEGGGSDVPFSPTFDYFRYVFLKILEKMGIKVKINILRRGYYPEGGAKVITSIQPWPINERQRKSINLLERGTLQKILAISGASESLRNKKVSERQLQGMQSILGKLKLPLETKVEYFDTNSPGSSICIICQFKNTLLGVDNLGKLGKPAEKIGQEATLQLLEEEKTQACLDRFLTDQILIYLALAKRESQIKIPQLTTHAQTNIWTIKQFIPGQFEVKDNIIKWKPK